MRRILLAHATGRVLETHVGSSRNLKFYKSNEEISNIVGVDWSHTMLELALVKDDQLVQYQLENTESLPFEDNVNQ